MTTVLTGGCTGPRSVEGAADGAASTVGADGGVAEVDAGPPLYQWSQGLRSCTNATLEDGKPVPAGKRCYTWRALAGVSMGGGSAARIAFHHPELFDAVGVMGTPFADFEAFFHMLETEHVSGFCPRENILSILQRDGGAAALDDPSTPGLWCGEHGDRVEGPLAVPSSSCWAFASDFNHWYRGPEAGRGGSFNRNGLVEVIQDMVTMYGNMAYHNPDHAYLPPGIPASHHIAPHTGRTERDAARSRICANPVVLNGVRDARWNPDGAFPVISFCDCSGCGSDYLPGRADLPLEVMLAVDYNRNGRRDWGEPILFTPHEPYRDVGLDGIAPGGSGDDLSDAYDYLERPLGHSGNGRFDEGEPFDDVGLDGIAGTQDYGEGDGRYTQTPALSRALADSPTRHWWRMSDAMAARLSIWMDAGVRDFLNSAQITNHLFGAIKARVPDSRWHRDFSSMSGLPAGASYEFTSVDYSPAHIGRNAYLLYGNADRCPDSDANLGDGNHVGPANQVLNRLLTLFAFVDARWPNGDRASINAPSAVDDHPNGFSAHLMNLTYHSTVLDRDQKYGVVLPPGYYYPENAGKRYPVIYFLHGQGMSSDSLTASGAVFMGYMFHSWRDETAPNADLQKFILVFPDGQCLGEECHTGNFFSDFVGFDGQGKDFEQAYLELMRYVDSSYRTRMPEIR